MTVIEADVARAIAAWQVHARLSQIFSSQKGILRNLHGRKQLLFL
ncbi:MAG: hypothetical protein ABIR56_17995 [Polaromonas sp.]